MIMQETLSAEEHLDLMQVMRTDYGVWDSSHGPRRLRAARGTRMSSSQLHPPAVRTMWGRYVPVQSFLAHAGTL